MPKARITVRERLSPEVTASLFANYRSSLDALLELIDNAVDSRRPSLPLRVELTLRPHSIQATSIGGHGMGPKEIERNYLRWGASPKRGRNLLGQYGQGGKAAIGHLGRSFTVEASRPGDPHNWQFSDPDYRDRSRLKVYELTPTPKSVDSDVGFARIEVRGVDRKLDSKRLANRVADTYRPLLEQGLLTIAVNGQALRAPDFPCSERHEFRVQAAGARLSGWFGLIDSGTPRSDGGIRCYHLGRLVSPSEFFGHPGPAQNPGIARLIGELEIPRISLTMNKTDFDRDGEAWLAIERRLHKLLLPMVRSLARETEVPPPLSAVRVAERVRKLLSQALRIADGPELFPGVELAGVGSQAPNEQEMLPIEAVLEEPTRRLPPSARPAATRDQPNRRGFGRIVLRPLEVSARSATIEEEGSKTIVINTHHPLFLERDGDIWYQLETAAREVFAALEGSSVREYERRVNEVMLLAMQLRTRRRQRRQRDPQLRLLST